MVTTKYFNLYTNLKVVNLTTFNLILSVLINSFAWSINIIVIICHRS